MAIQNHYEGQGYSVREVVPELLNALLSLAGFVAKNNADMSVHEFLAACHIAAAENYDK